MNELSESTRRRIGEALAEDVGSGDRTSTWCVDSDVDATAHVVTRGHGVISGLAAAACVFHELGGVDFRPLVGEGDGVATGDAVVRLAGGARSILTGERTALNFLSRLSGIATLTRRFVDAVDGTGVRITDTRKTTPLWRELERRATHAGGAVNHRSGLYDMVLIKENHIACAGGIAVAVRRARETDREALRIEVETTNLAEVEEALRAGVDRIMLDNMAPADLRDAVRLIRAHEPTPEIEASGGVTLANVRAVAATGVDYVSVGTLTHSAPALDLSLRVET